jgi:hypothetical protein
VAKLNFAVLCVRAIVDRETNLLSIIDIVEETTFTVPAEAIKAASPIFLLQNPMVLVLDFSRSQANAPETARMRVKTLDPTGNEIGQSEIVLDMQTVTRSRGFVRLAGMPVSSEGIFKYDVQVLGPDESWLPVTEVLLPVKILPAV